MPDPANDDLMELRALAARLQPDQVTWEQPPPGLWERIAADAADEPPAADATRSDDAVVTSIDRARSAGRRGPWLLAAAAAVVLVVAGVIVATRDGSDADVVAQAPLEPLGTTGSGRAELLDEGGTMRLHVETADLDAGDGFLEVWVIDPTVTRLVSLGPLRPDGTYDLPAGLDPAEFPIVDVSVEPIDGNPTHSGDSVLRGELQFA